MITSTLSSGLIVTNFCRGLLRVTKASWPIEGARGLAKILNAAIEASEYSMERSPRGAGGQQRLALGDQALVNDVLIRTWTAPVDFADQQGVQKPRRWKLAGAPWLTARNVIRLAGEP